MVPNTLLKISTNHPVLSFGVFITFQCLRSGIEDINTAIIFLKKPFCIDGKSPDNLTNKDINANPNPAVIIQNIPFKILLLLFILKNLQ